MFIDFGAIQTSLRQSQLRHWIGHRKYVGALQVDSGFPGNVDANKHATIIDAMFIAQYEFSSFIDVFFSIHVDLLL